MGASIDKETEGAVDDMSAQESDDVDEDEDEEEEEEDAGLILKEGYWAIRDWYRKEREKKKEREKIPFFLRQLEDHDNNNKITDYTVNQPKVARTETWKPHIYKSEAPGLF